MKFNRVMAAGAAAVVTSALIGVGVTSTVAAAAPKAAKPLGYLYTSENHIKDNHNAVAGYAIAPDGKLTPLKQGMVLTGGTGTDNGYIPGQNLGNAKLGPMDNDSPVVATPNGKFVYVINGHTDTIAGFKVGSGGTLTKVPGSPFYSHGINPTSIDINKSGTVMAVANRNEDPARQGLLNTAISNVTTFAINTSTGALTWTKSTAYTPGTSYGAGTKSLPTQVHFPAQGNGLLFVNNFRIDIDWNTPGATYSQQWYHSAQVNGFIESHSVTSAGKVANVDKIDMPDDQPGAVAGVPSIPLNVWSHPTKKILYTNLVTRNAVGVMTYDDAGEINFETAVPSTGRDVCWLRTNSDGTRLYQISNNSNPDEGDKGSSIQVFDISGDNALNPVQLQHISVPTFGLTPFVNDRGQTQAATTAFIPTLFDDKFFYVGLQRVNQTPENTETNGNYIIGYPVKADGTLDESKLITRNLAKDGFAWNSRAWGLAAIKAS
jgi:6-phosphogluconolactonase (cycloisomerase 2 family)